MWWSAGTKFANKQQRRPVYSWCYQKSLNVTRWGAADLYGWSIKVKLYQHVLPAKLKLYQKNEMPRDKGKLSKSPMSLEKFSSHASYIITVVMISFLKKWADRRKLLEKHHTNWFFFTTATFAVRQKRMMDIDEAWASATLTTLSSVKWQGAATLHSPARSCCNRRRKYCLFIIIDSKCAINSRSFWSIATLGHTWPAPHITLCLTPGPATLLLLRTKVSKITLASAPCKTSLKGCRRVRRGFCSFLAT